MEYPNTIEDLPKEECLATVGNRPLALQLLFLAFGIFLFVTAIKNWYVGLFFVAMSIVSLVVTKDYTACKIYRDKIVIYNPDDQNHIRIVEFDQIVSYQVDPKNQAYVIINISDKESSEHLGIPTFRAARVKGKLFRLIPDKDFDTMRIKEFQSKLSRPKKKK